MLLLGVLAVGISSLERRHARRPAKAAGGIRGTQARTARQSRAKIRRHRRIVPRSAKVFSASASVRRTCEADSKTVIRTHYLLPFEIVSVHLLVVLIGAAYLARAKRRRSVAS